MRTLILPAGGQETRWAGPFPKQLADVNGETAIGRLVRQLSPHFDRVHILAWHPMILKRYPKAFMPEGHATLHESLLNTHDLWTERTVFVYADVILSERAAKSVWQFDGPAQFFGEYSECMAASFGTPDALAQVRRALELAMTDECKYWAFYRNYHGLPRGLPRYHDGGRLEYTHFNDWSSDIDTEDQYRRTMLRMRREGDYVQVQEAG
jgi:hypothetical protein